MYRIIIVSEHDIAADFLPSTIIIKGQVFALNNLVYLNSFQYFYYMQFYENDRTKF